MDPKMITDLITDPKVVAFVVALIGLAIGLYINAKMKQNVDNRLAAERITDSTVLATGITVRWDTSTGPAEGIVDAFLDTQVRIYIPANGKWRPAYRYVANAKFIDDFVVVNTDVKEKAS